MDRVYEFREQAVKAKQEIVTHLEENRELKAKLEQVWAPLAGSITATKTKTLNITSRSASFIYARRRIVSCNGVDQRQRAQFCF